VGVFGGGISIFMIMMGVVFYENLTLEIVLILLTFVLSVIYLVYRKKRIILLLWRIHRTFSSRILSVELKDFRGKSKNIQICTSSQQNQNTGLFYHL